ncbi:DUF7117 family protein [Halalkalicoccus jeotgali]|uniref:TFIIB-type zinc ribbon-containing protein n=1 Tax=Halalkalicoccus jeotgali (strain DSM 18796 / CECT 7217 / JCM 14584 / KCTC 4019 / B3) TaxID=795797 RepID=D8J379_HALJB|nr:hypothetical protein [Halalkalicoccus jeotgali]ADJ15186.1 hypothetical protein HacjB3_09015 [Halalkalicoccus jeotgali B3]ELY35237.1 hypothetical protein C497_13663 [Halalkalicoccus jeotgali B3]
MEIRGERECTACGTRWSYYETGEVACPDCGSLRSVGHEERKLHTDGPAELDLAPLIEGIDERPLSEVASEVAERCRSYRRKRGFVDGGELRDLDDTYLIASELGTAIGSYERSLSSGALETETDDAEQLYLLALLGGERPPPAEVPDSLVSARALAYAKAVSTYREDLLAFLDAREEASPTVRRALGRLDDHVRRVEALDGSVETRTPERLVEAARDLGSAVRDDDELALARARERLDALG